MTDFEPGVQLSPDTIAAMERLSTSPSKPAMTEIEELRARIEALEAAQRVRSGPESPLVERVADAIAAQATSAGIVNDRPARAAILKVAAWFRTERDSTETAAALEQEANR